MTITRARRLLDDFLSTVTSTMGFRLAECSEHVRLESDDATGLLSWPCRLDPRGFVAFSGIVGVRFEYLSKWLVDDANSKAATVATPLHLLRSDNRFVEWTFTDIVDLEHLRGPILDDLNTLAIPFIERYSTLPNLRKAVESAIATDWINVGLNHDSRVCVLAAIQIVEGDRLGAMKTLDDALAERKGALPKRRFKIEQLRRRLVEST